MITYMNIYKYLRMKFNFAIYTHRGVNIFFKKDY